MRQSPRQRNSPSSAGADPLSGKADERFCRVGRLLPGAQHDACLSLRLSSAQVSLILCSEPVFTAIVSFVLLAEALSGVGLAGTGIIIGCIVAETYILSSDAAASPQKTPEGAV